MTPAAENIRITVAYDGTAYHGWQRQPGLPTVQGALEQALASRLKQPAATVWGAGRTDAGVHACGQTANFLAPVVIPPARWPAALNVLLPRDVRVRHAARMPPFFHARYDAAGKRYLYVCDTRPARRLFSRRFAHPFAPPLDLDAMRAAARCWCGTHDFAAFTTHAREQGDTTRTLHRVRVWARAGFVGLDFSGTAFLWNQVRTMAGTLLEIGRGARAADEAAAILAARDRRRAGPNLPPEGLFLRRVYYPPDAGTRPHRSFARADLPDAGPHAAPTAPCGR